MFVPYFTEYARVIEDTMRDNYGITLMEPNLCGDFMDCNLKETTTPGSGPQTNDPGLDRHTDVDTLQGAVYSGYRSF